MIEEIERKKLKKILLTSDGKGREEKEKALEMLLADSFWEGKRLEKNERELLRIMSLKSDRKL